MQNYDEIKGRKNFYRDLFRRCVMFNMILGILGLAQAGLIFTLYIAQPEPDYYATSGITNPIELTALNAPNYGQEPLLTPDMPDEMSSGKSIPQ